jgi:hypothetical protein
MLSPLTRERLVGTLSGRCGMSRAMDSSVRARLQRNVADECGEEILAGLGHSPGWWIRTATGSASARPEAGSSEPLTSPPPVSGPTTLARGLITACPAAIQALSYAVPVPSSSPSR